MIITQKVKYPLIELQAIAMAIADATTAKDIELVISREGITLNPELGAKWRMLTDVFIKCDENSFFRMLAEFLYFTNDEQEEKIKKILGRHGIHIEYTGEDWFIVNQKDLITTDDEVEAHEANEKVEKQVKSDENLAEKIKEIREHHQAYIDVIEQFCKDYKNPSKELNEAYIYLKNLLADELKELGISLYCPFKDLYFAEREYTPEPIEIRLDGRPAIIDWDYFRPRLYSVHSQIVQLLSNAKTTTKTETKIQEINSFVSQLRDEQLKIYKAKNKTIREKVGKIRIVGETAIKIKGFEEKVVLQKPKDKKIQLRKFPSDLRWEEISIRFLNEHEVIIKAKNETLQTTFEAMGFQDEKKKLPNKQWVLLRLLAVRNGELSWENNSNLSLKEINKIKKQKQLLSETLRAFFQISNDPFYDYKAEKSYRIKLNLTPEPELKDMDEREVIEDNDKIGLKNYYKEQTPEVNDG